MKSKERNDDNLINSNAKSNSVTESHDKAPKNLVTNESQNSVQQTTSSEATGNASTPFISTPARVLTSMYTTRLGIILSNVAVICVLFCLSSIVSVVISCILWMFGVVLILMTLGLILVAIPGYWNALVSSSDVIGKVSNFLIQAWPIISVTGIVCSVASIVLLALDRNQRHIGRIVFSSIIIGMIVLIMIILAVEGSRA